MMIQVLPCRCGKCGHEFMGEIVVQAKIDVALASMKAIRCPECGQGPKKIYIGHQKPATAPNTVLPEGKEGAVGAE